MPYASNDKRNARRRELHAEKAAVKVATHKYTLCRQSMYDRRLACIKRGDTAGELEASQQLQSFKANRKEFIQQETKELMVRRRNPQPSIPLRPEDLIEATQPPASLPDQLSALGRPATSDELRVLQESYENDQDRALLSQVATNALTTTGNAMANVANAVSNVTANVSNTVARRWSPQKKKASAATTKQKKGSVPSRSNKKKAGGTRTQPQEAVSKELVVVPEFAMAKRSVVSTHEWNFKLEPHVMAIHERVPDRDLYLVGYRDEERPNLFDENARTSVPFFAVHLLEKGKPAPQYIMVYDGEKKTEDIKSLAVAPFKWIVLHTFPAGETVSILQFDGRTTKRSVQTQSSISVGGQVFFLTRFNSKQNPGEDGDDDFLITSNGDDRCFDSEVWGWTKPGLREAISNSEYENWVDCCCRSKNAEYLEIALPPAVEAFFKVNDDWDRSVCEEDVKQALSSMFLRFKKKVIAHEKRSNLMRAKGAVDSKDAIHFKIYPENEELRRYIKFGDNEYISSCSGKATAVYPQVDDEEEETRTDVAA